MFFVFLSLLEDPKVILFVLHLYPLLLLRSLACFLFVFFWCILLRTKFIVEIKQRLFHKLVSKSEFRKLASLAEAQCDALVVLERVVDRKTSRGIRWLVVVLPDTFFRSIPVLCS